MSAPNTGGLLSFMRNAEGVTVAVVLAVVLWLGNTTYTNSITLTEMRVVLENIEQRQIEGINGLSGRIDEHERSFATIWPRLRELKERIQVLESERPKDARPLAPWRL